MKKLFISLSLMALTACAQQPLQIDAGAGAKCSITNDRNNIQVVSPAKFSINRGLNNLDVACEHNGKKATASLPPVDVGASGLIKIEYQ